MLKTFHYCSSLTSVTVDISTPLLIDANTFSNRANATLYVPFGSTAAYEAADYWKEFNEIVEIIPPTLTLVDATSYTNNRDVEFDELTYSRYFKNTNWQAWYVPFDMEITNELLTRFSFGKFAGTYTDEDEFFLTVAYMKEGDMIKANTPYFVKAKVADSSNPQLFTLNDVTLKASEETGFIMLSAEKKITIQGIYAEKVATEGDCDWYAYGGGLYRHPTVGQKLSPNRFFMTIEDREDNPYASTPIPSEVRMMVLGEETGIEEIQDGEPRMKNEAGAVYDLSGRKMVNGKISKGIYIINGKKVLVK